MSQKEKGSKNDIIGKLTIKASVGQCYFQVTSKLNMSQQGQEFILRYNRNIYTLSICRRALRSGNVQSEHVATGESVLTTILLYH